MLAIVYDRLRTFGELSILRASGDARHTTSTHHVQYDLTFKVDSTEAQMKCWFTNVKLVIALLGLCLNSWDVAGQASSKLVKYEGFLVREKSVKKNQMPLEIRMTHFKTVGDTAYYKLYFEEAVRMFGNEFAVLKVIGSKYFIGLDNQPLTRLGKGSYEFLDLNAPINSRNELEFMFHFISVDVILIKREYSPFLKDTLLTYSLQKGDCPSHHSCLVKFVFAEKYGFISLVFHDSPDSKVYYFPRGLRKNFDKDSVLSSLGRSVAWK